MIQLYHDSLWISFGNKQNFISMKDIKELRQSQSLHHFLQSAGFDRLIVLDQQHTVDGICIEQIADFEQSWFTFTADFLVTNRNDVALVVLTADCMPLILYDQRQKAVAIIHAGWRGIAGDIVSRAIMMMQNLYGTQMHDMVSIIGPCARQCCYEVSENFLDNFIQIDGAQETMIHRDGRWYFNSILFVEKQLQGLGLLSQNIKTKYALCTICNEQYCSYRREKDKSHRQATIVVLQK